MQVINASFLLCFLVPLFCLAEAVADPLVGVWQHRTFVQTAEGKVVRQYDSTDGGTLEFRPDGTWYMRDGAHQSAGTYRRMSSGFLESTITSSDFPKQVGHTSMKKATVKDQALVLVTEYNEEGMKVMVARPDGTRPTSMSVTSTFRKIGVKK